MRPHGRGSPWRPRPVAPATPRSKRSPTSWVTASPSPCSSGTRGTTRPSRCCWGSPAAPAPGPCRGCPPPGPFAPHAARSGSSVPSSRSRARRPSPPATPGASTRGTTRTTPTGATHGSGPGPRSPSSRAFWAPAWPTGSSAPPTSCAPMPTCSTPSPQPPAPRCRAPSTTGVSTPAPSPRSSPRCAAASCGCCSSRRGARRDRSPSCTSTVDALLVGWRGQGPADLPGEVRVARVDGRLHALAGPGAPPAPPGAV